jgi:hypothetical protein
MLRISDKAKAADAAKPANASGIHRHHETLIESLPELQRGNHLGKVDAKHGPTKRIVNTSLSLGL